MGRILRNVTGLDPGQSSSYEDLWRFTLVNYNAGPGCLGNAVNRRWPLVLTLDWENVIAQLEPACQGAIGYVEDISAMRRIGPTPTPWLGSAGALPTVAYPRVQTTPTPRATGLVRTPTQTPTVTATPNGSETPTATATLSGSETPEPTEENNDPFATVTPLP